MIFHHSRNKTMWQSNHIHLWWKRQLVLRKTPKKLQTGCACTAWDASTGSLISYKTYQYGSSSSWHSLILQTQISTTIMITTNMALVLILLKLQKRIFSRLFRCHISCEIREPHWRLANRTCWWSAHLTRKSEQRRVQKRRKPSPYHWWWHEFTEVSHGSICFDNYWW